MVESCWRRGRLGYVLAAGRGAIERMVDELNSHSIDVHIVRTTVENPVPGYSEPCRQSF